MAMSNNINEYVGKTFSYMLGVQNILCIVHVTGVEHKSERYIGDSYVGTCILLKADGTMLGEQRAWASEIEYFNKLDKTRLR